MFKKFLNFPKSNLKNVRLFYIIGGAMSFWLIEAIWYFYWAKFASYSQIGVMFAVLTFVWIFMEIPTGAIADMFGRKKSVIIGTASLFIGSTVIAMSQNIGYLFFGGMLQNIGRAFVSGSMEALVYDDLKSRNEEDWYDDVIATKQKVSLIMYAVGSILGGFMYLIYFRLPHITTAIVELIIFILSFSLIEIEVVNKPKINFKNYLIQNLEGFRQLFKKSLRPYLILIIFNMAIFYLYDWGFSKPAMATGFGFYTNSMGIIYAVMGILQVFVVGWLTYLRSKINDYKGMIYLNILLGTGFILSILPFGFYGVIVLFLIESVGAMSTPWISVIINKEINSQDRATTLSSLEFVSKLPFIFLVFISGPQIENHTISNIHLSVGVFLITLSLIYFFVNKASPKTQIS